MKFPLLSDNAAFADFCAQAAQHTVVGIDTEFVWTDSYYARLGLVQLAWDTEHCALIDPIAITDRAPFRALLENPSVLKVFHEAASDLPILRRWCGALPKNVADTRIEAGFCGLTAQMSLAKLLAMQLSVVLPKTETRTNWLQRPLTPAQLAYAGDDVTLLPALNDNLNAILSKVGNVPCFAEEMACLEKESFYAEPPVEDAWKRVSRPAFLKFTHQDYAVLQQLAAWRENLARQQDITKNRIMRDEWLAIAAVKHPYTAAEVANIHGIRNTTVKKYGDAVAQIVTDAMKLPKVKWPDMFFTPLDRLLLKQCADRIIALVAKRADARKIDPVLVCSRKDAESLATAAARRKPLNNSPLMQGWRYALLSPAIDEICEDFATKSK